MENIREFKKNKEMKKDLKYQRKFSLTSKNSQVSQKSITNQVVGGFFGAISGTMSAFGKNNKN